MIDSLEQIKSPELINYDRESLENEVIERIKQHPSWSESYNGMLHHESFTMILAIFSFLFGKNSEHFDRKIKERFIGSAKADESKVMILSEKNIQPKQAKESTVLLQGIFSNYKTGEIFYIPKSTLLYGTGLNGEQIPFEIITKNDNGFDFFNDVEIDPGQNLISFNVYAYSGQTFRYEYELDETKEKFDINIPYSNIIDDSIKVYFYLNGSYFQLEEVKFENLGETITDIFPSGAPKYYLTYSLDSSVSISFGTDTFGGTFKDAHKDGKLVIFGRYNGGGSSSQIAEGDLNTTIPINVEGEVYTNINFTNIISGVGGVDAEDFDNTVLYASKRVGRGKQIIDKQDSKNALNNIVLKHKMESPSYSEEQINKVPLLHLFHYIVPNKDIENIVLIIPTSSDSVSSYGNQITQIATDFFSVQGTHDSSIDNEFISLFTKDGSVLNFYYTLKNSNILSNSLKLKAFNINDEQIDEIEFIGNYPLNNQVYNKIYNNKAQAISEAFSTTTLIISSSYEDRANNNFQIRFDDHDFIFNITFSSGEYLYNDIANHIDYTIKQTIESALNPTILGYDHDLYLIRNSHTFASFDSTTNKISFISPKYNERSQVEIIAKDTDIATINFCEDIKISPMIYRPTRSKIVFKDELSYFKYSNSDIFISINDINNLTVSSFDADPAQNIASDEGPMISFSLFDIYLNQITQIQSASNITVSLYNDDTFVDEVVFNSINDINTIYYGADSSNTSVGAIRASSECYFDTETGSVSLQLVDPIESLPYISGFDTSGTLIRIDIFKYYYNGGDLVEELQASFPASEDWLQEPDQEAGPKFTLMLSLAEALETNYNYIVKMIINDGTTDSIGKEFKFDAVTDYLTEGYVSGGSVDMLNTSELPVYDNNLNNITITLIDGIIDSGADTVYMPNWIDFNKVKITHTKKNYSYITAEYSADSYHPEGEAKQYMDILNQKNKRAIGLENIIKDINYIPIGFEIDLYVRSTYSKLEAKEEAYNYLMSYMQYNNSYPKHDIGININQNILTDIILEIPQEFGIVKAELKNITMYTDNIDTDKLSYFFTLDDNTLLNISGLEEEYLNIKGLSDSLRIKINAVTE